MPATTRPPFLPSRGIAWWAMALAVAVLTAWLTLQSIQLGCTITLLVLTIGVYVRNRTAGLALVWLTWLLAPFLRRIFLLSEPIQNADPLALAPFLITAAVIVLELSQVRLSRRARRLLTLAVAGFAVGIPSGLLFAPRAAVFALFAYLAGVGCFVIGYREGDRRTLVLPSVLMIALPVLALYAFRQYYLPLPEWDFIWQRSADINSVGALESGRVRVWSTLNSPGTFAIVLGVAAIALVSWRRVTPLKLAGLLVVFGALALTYVRSVWVGVLFALLAIVVVTRGAALKRVLPVLAVLAITGPIVLGGSTGTAIVDRFKSFGSLGNDRSTQERAGTGGLVQVAAGNPLGTGLGSAGEANRLSDAGAGIRYTDNGYFSLLAQVGPAGFLVVLSVFLAALASAWRNAWRRVDTTDVLVFGVLAFLAVELLAGDAFFGIGGMMLWYTSGLAIRRRELHERVSP